MAFQGVPGQCDAHGRVLVFRRFWGACWRSQATSNHVGRVRGSGGKGGDAVAGDSARAARDAGLAGVGRPGELAGEGRWREGAWVDGAPRCSVAPRAWLARVRRVLGTSGTARSRRGRVDLRQGLV
jgi:hypothetical protein